MRGCLGGTFDIIHEGHMSLFREAFRRFDELVVGVTSDSFAGERKGRRVRPYRSRASGVRSRLSSLSPIPFKVVRLDDACGPALDPSMEGIAVSAETLEGAKEINRKRCELGLAPLSIFTVPVLTLGGQKVSAGHYRAQSAAFVELDGPRGSAEGVKSAFLRFYPLVEIAGEGGGRRKGARFSVALRSSTLESDGRRYACMSADVRGPGGFSSRGMGAGCLSPEGLSMGIEDGASIDEAAARLSMEAEGTVGEAHFLMAPFKGVAQLAEDAVLAALVPLTRPELFGKGRKSWPLGKRRKAARRQKLYIMKGAKSGR